MATLPPDSPPPGPAAHLNRRLAEGFGSEASRYDRTRPGYPADLIDRIVAASPGRDVLDVGSGTGIAARQFQAAGCQVLGVEADPRMAATARQLGTPTEVGRFEDWDPAGRSFDAVVAAMAWHWVDPVAGAAKAGAVLRPGGRLALFWNVFDPPDALREPFAAAYRRALPEAPQAARFWSQPALPMYRAMGGKSADGMRQAGVFGEPQEWLVHWERRYTRDEWLDLVPTTGGFDRLAAPVQAQLLSGLGDPVDALGGSFVMGYDTLTVTAARA